MRLANKEEIPNEPAMRARVFKDYLDNPVFEAGLQNYKEQIIDAWLATEPTATERRELLWFSYQTALSVKGHIIRGFTKAQNDLHIHKLQKGA